MVLRKESLVLSEILEKLFKEVRSQVIVRLHCFGSKKIWFNWIKLHVDVPEWSNGQGLGPCGLVPTKVRILTSTFFFIHNIL